MKNINLLFILILMGCSQKTEMTRNDFEREISKLEYNAAKLLEVYKSESDAYSQYFHEDVHNEHLKVLRSAEEQQIKEDVLSEKEIVFSKKSKENICKRKKIHLQIVDHISNNTNLWSDNTQEKLDEHTLQAYILDRKDECPE